MKWVTATPISRPLRHSGADIGRNALEHKTKPLAKVRQRRPRADIREELLKSALVEFGAKGFDGASTRAIAARIQAHQPQINYHFESKAALWRAAVDYLFGLMAEKLWDVLPANASDVGVEELAAAFADGIRRFVRFAAEHPELNRIMVIEGTTATDRSTWMSQTYVKPFFNGIRKSWDVLRNAGIAAPIDHDILYYVIIGAAFVALRQRTGSSPTHRSGSERSQMD